MTNSQNINAIVDEMLEATSKKYPNNSKIHNLRFIYRSLIIALDENKYIKFLDELFSKYLTSRDFTRNLIDYVKNLAQKEFDEMNINIPKKSSDCNDKVDLIFEEYSPIWDSLTYSFLKREYQEGYILKEHNKDVDMNTKLINKYMFELNNLNKDEYDFVQVYGSVSTKRYTDVMSLEKWIN
jgi:CRISPR-associated protein Cas8b1/Cst1 subtype I-B